MSLLPFLPKEVPVSDLLICKILVSTKSEAETNEKWKKRRQILMGKGEAQPRTAGLGRERQPAGGGAQAAGRDPRRGPVVHTARATLYKEVIPFPLMLSLSP